MYVFIDQVVMKPQTFRIIFVVRSVDHVYLSTSSRAVVFNPSWMVAAATMLSATRLSTTRILYIGIMGQSYVEIYGIKQVFIKLLDF